MNGELPLTWLYVITLHTVITIVNVVRTRTLFGVICWGTIRVLALKRYRSSSGLWRSCSPWCWPSRCYWHCRWGRRSCGWWTWDLGYLLQIPESQNPCLGPLRIVWLLMTELEVESGESLDNCFIAACWHPVCLLPPDVHHHHCHFNCKILKRLSSDYPSPTIITRLRRVWGVVWRE